MYTRLDDEDLLGSPVSLRRQTSMHVSLIKTLSEMGFSTEFGEVAIAYTNSNNLEDLLAFMIKGERGWEHEFIRN